jgi:flagellar protein FlgJ
MINPTGLDGKFALDSKDVEGLRQAARQNSPEAVKATSKQFEALFMNMVLKSMRDATPQDGIFDSEQSKMYTSMFDQQISQTMASRGIGLAEVLYRQLSKMTSQGSPAAPGDPTMPGSDMLPALQSPSAEGQAPIKSNPSQPSHVRDFTDRLAPHAEEASRATGIPARFMLGQAALESGWGKHEIVGTDGTRSYNLFGIKATAGWNGKVVEAVTTEYVNGVPQTKLEKFRAYDSYADSFRDYAKLLRSNPRYESVLANAQDISGFAQGLQKAGYATDPNYATKLMRIIKQSLSA